MAPTSQTITDINLISRFLASQKIANLSTEPQIDAIVICASELLFQTTSVLDVLSQTPSLTKALVLCGGIGHSTTRIYDAVSRHPKFRGISDEIHGLPEARVLEKILDEFYDRSQITSRGCQILIEDQSTNCGMNAINSRKVLDDNRFEWVRKIIVVQDPTMALRTVASFGKAYADRKEEIEILSWPVVVPVIDI